MRTWAIILAAGRGSRLQAALPGQSKQLLDYKGAPLFWRSASAFASVPRVCGLVFAVPPEQLEEYKRLVHDLSAEQGLGLPYLVVAGGSERQDSVWNALNALPPDCTDVLVHDSARPFATPRLISSVLDALELGHQGVIPGVPPSDTVKQADESGTVSATLPRSMLRYIQTPQGFKRPVLHKAHEEIRAHGLAVTDDSAVLEYCGVPVLIVPGEPDNRKITGPEDLDLLRHAGGPDYSGLIPCCALGYDVHAYGGDKPFVLGGISITNTDIRLKAHSDGDVLLHALTDALLGLSGGADIGVMFPDTDPAYAGISSAILLSEALETVRAGGIIITHVDITLVAQTPKIFPFRREIRRNVAHLLHLEERKVGLKATTEEGLGFTGACQGIKAMAAVSALRKP